MIHFVRMLSVLALLFAALPAWAADYLFGYGSLMNADSRQESDARPTPGVAARISAEFGYVRTWNVAGSDQTYLGLRERRPGEAGSTINGVVFEADEVALAAFDRRERGYRRAEVPRALIEAIGHQRLPPDGRIWLYVPVAAGAHAPTARRPIAQSYVDICMLGGLAFGEAFAAEFVRTTEGWSQFRRKDRTLPAQSFPQAANIDRLLVENQRMPAR